MAQTDILKDPASFTGLRSEFLTDTKKTGTFMYSGISGNILMEGQGGIHQLICCTHGSPKTLDRLPKTTFTTK